MEADKRTEARRLVEDERLSLLAAAERVGVSEKTVRRWQKLDEAAGDGWVLPDGRSGKAKARAESMTVEERMAASERARKITENRWANRRGPEADAAGSLAVALREQIANILPRVGASVIDAEESVGLLPQRLSSTAKNLVIAYAVALDKADLLAGVNEAALAPDELAVDDEVAQARSLLDGIEARRLKAV